MRQTTGRLVGSTSISFGRRAGSPCLSGGSFSNCMNGVICPAITPGSRLSRSQRNERDDGPEGWRRLTGALDLLCRAQERSPSAVTTVLLYPQVGAWAGHCLRRVRRNGLEAAAAELDYMAAVAAG